MFLILLILGGAKSFYDLGKLEDPEFTVKTAVIATPYPGAGPERVEKEVTERIEIALQEVAEIDFVESVSRAGLSIVKIEVKAEYWSDRLPQIWDEVRRKVRRVENELPIGALRPEINDDFGNVYGFVLAVTGDGYMYKQLEEHTENLKRKLSLVEGVARIDFWGKRDRSIYLKVSESRLAELGLNAHDIQRALSLQDSSTPSGSVYYDERSARIEISGAVDTIEQIKDLTLGNLRDGDASLIQIREIAEVVEGFVEPTMQTMRYNGREAIGLAISSVPSENIVELGKRLESQIKTLEQEIPVGVELNKVAWQAEEVTAAINVFVSSLIQAIIIVLVVITLFMGWRMGIIIGTALLLTISGTLIVMNALGIDLQRMSLGALVIALGMMVDNAIVVGDGMAIRLRRGMGRSDAAIDAA